MSFSQAVPARQWEAFTLSNFRFLPQLETTGQNFISKEVFTALNIGSSFSSDATMDVMTDFKLIDFTVDPSPLFSYPCNVKIG